MNRTSDSRFLLLLFLVVFIVGLIAYQNSQNLIKAKEAGDILKKENIDILVLSQAKRRIKNACHSEFAKNTLKEKLVALNTSIDCILNRKVKENIFSKITWAKNTDEIHLNKNRVSFKIPLVFEKFKIEQNEITNKVRITIPAIELDMDSIRVQTKPSLIEIKENGLLIPISQNDEVFDKELTKELKEFIVYEANQDKLLKSLAKEKAYVIAYNFFYMLISDLLKDNNMELEIVIP